MTTRTTALALSVLTGLAVLAPAGIAQADPKGGPVISINCGAKGTFTATTSKGGGQFIPAHVVGSKGVLVPVSFGTFSGTIRNASNQVVAQFTEDSTSVKGSGKQRNVTACTYSISETFTVTDEEAMAEGLPGAGTYTFTGTGVVGLQIRGR